MGLCRRRDAKSDDYMYMLSQLMRHPTVHSSSSISGTRGSSCYVRCIFYHCSCWKLTLNLQKKKTNNRPSAEVFKVAFDERRHEFRLYILTSLALNELHNEMSLFLKLQLLSEEINLIKGQRDKNCSQVITARRVHHG